MCANWPLICCIIKSKFRPFFTFPIPQRFIPPLSLSLCAIDRFVFPKAMTSIILLCCSNWTPKSPSVYADNEILLSEPGTSDAIPFGDQGLIIDNRVPEEPRKPSDISQETLNLDIYIPVCKLSPTASVIPLPSRRQLSISSTKRAMLLLKFRQSISIKRVFHQCE